MLQPFFRFAGIAAVRILHGCHCATAWSAELPHVHAAIAAHLPLLTNEHAHVVLLAICTLLAVAGLRRMFNSFFHFTASALQIMLCLTLWAEIWAPARAFIQICLPLLANHTLYLVLLSAATVLVVVEVLALLAGIEPD